MNIPEDPFMLLSFINMKLRDGEYETLSELCETLDCNEGEIVSKLKENGFEFNPEIKQFR